MKKNIFLAMAAVVVMFFTGCSKDIDLVGTTWKANYSNSITYMGMSGTVSLDLVINFTDATNYKLDQSASVTIMGQTMPQSSSETGTYTFDGENGMFDGEQAFTYNKKDKTITTTITFDDAEFEEMFGSNSIALTFTQQ